jgi:hypothetical protein
MAPPGAMMTAVTRLVGKHFVGERMGRRSAGRDNE